GAEKVEPGRRQLRRALPRLSASGGDTRLRSASQLSNWTNDGPSESEGSQATANVPPIRPGFPGGPSIAPAFCGCHLRRVRRKSGRLRCNSLERKLSPSRSDQELKLQALRSTRQWLFRLAQDSNCRNFAVSRIAAFSNLETAQDSPVGTFS